MIQPGSRSPERLTPGVTPVSRQRLQAPAEHHLPGPNPAAENGSSAQSALISSFQLPLILAKPSPAKLAATSNPHTPARRSPISRGFVHRRLSDAGPLTASIAHARPGSENLTNSRPSAPRYRKWEPRKPDIRRDGHYVSDVRFANSTLLGTGSRSLRFWGCSKGCARALAGAGLLSVCGYEGSWRSALETEGAGSDRPSHMDVEANTAFASRNIEIEATIAEVQVPGRAEGIVDRAQNCRSVWAPTIPKPPYRHIQSHPSLAEIDRRQHGHPNLGSSQAVAPSTQSIPTVLI